MMMTKQEPELNSTGSIARKAAEVKALSIRWNNCLAKDSKNIKREITFPIQQGLVKCDNHSIFTKLLK